MSLQEIFATRANRMKASEIRELLKLLDQPDIISFAGGIPDPDLFPKTAFQDAFAEALNGPDFTPFTETIFHKAAGLGPEWHETLCLCISVF